MIVYYAQDFTYIFFPFNKNMKRKRKQQDDQENVSECKRAKPASGVQTSVHAAEQEKKVMNRKKRKVGDGDKLSNVQKKICKDKVTDGRTGKDKQQVKNKPDKEVHPPKVTSSPTGMKENSNAKKVKKAHVQKEKLTKETDGEKTESKAGSTDSKKVNSKKMNKWQRFKKKKDMQKTVKKDASKETKNVSSPAVKKGSKSAQPVESQDVSSNWKKLQQVL